MFNRKKTINHVVKLPVRDIMPNKAQPRKVFDKDSLEGLAQSIAANGLLQPITVRKLGGHTYELIAGERRLQAFSLLGHSEIPAIIEDIDSKQSAVLALLENLQRCDLNYFEEAKAMMSLIKTCGLTQQQLAIKLGKSQSAIANKLRLLKIDDDIKDIMLTNKLTERHARAILKLENPYIQHKVIMNIIEKELNVQESEDYINKYIKQQATKNVNEKIVLKDLRLFFNSVNKSINTVKQMGVEIQSEQTENEDSIELLVKIIK